MDNELPMEEPPPYSEVADNGSVSIDQGSGIAAAHRLNVQTHRPSQSSVSQSSLNSAQSSRLQPSSRPGSSHSSVSSIRPPGPPPKHKPPPGPPPSERYRPPPGPPPPGSPSGRPSGKPSSNSHHQPPPSHFQQGGVNNAPPPPRRPQLRYPKGYFCQKCHNTGVKVYKGTSCQDCFERFGVRSQAQYLPSGMMPVFNAPPRVVPPGDPSIGGWLCGRCRGAGFITDFLVFDSTCPVCHGVGRVF